MHSRWGQYSPFSMVPLWNLLFLLLLLLLLLKPAAQAQVGKTKLFINCFRNRTSTCATENWRETQLMEVANGWLHTLFNQSMGVSVSNTV